MYKFREKENQYKTNFNTKISKQKAPREKIHATSSMNKISIMRNKIKVQFLQRKI